MIRCRLSRTARGKKTISTPPYFTRGRQAEGLDLRHRLGAHADRCLLLVPTRACVAARCGVGLPDGQDRGRGVHLNRSRSRGDGHLEISKQGTEHHTRCRALLFVWPGCVCVVGPTRRAPNDIAATSNLAPWGDRGSDTEAVRCGAMSSGARLGSEHPMPCEGGSSAGVPAFALEAGMNGSSVRTR